MGESLGSRLGEKEKSHKKVTQPENWKFYSFAALIASIWCENMLEYLSRGQIFSQKRTLGPSYVLRLKDVYQELIVCNRLILRDINLKFVSFVFSMILSISFESLFRDVAHI